MIVVKKSIEEVLNKYKQFTFGMEITVSFLFILYFHKNRVNVFFFSLLRSACSKTLIINPRKLSALRLA